MNHESRLNFQTTEFEIINKAMINSDVALFSLKGRLDFKPGQFVEVALPHFGNVTLAPCSNPFDKKKFELCVRAQGSTSSALVELLPGDKISLRGPYGHGWPMNQFSGKDIIVIAGGMGLVPLRPVIYDFEEKIYLSKIRIFAGFKKPDDILFLDNFKYWLKKFKIEISVENTERGFWGSHGLITEPLAKARFNPAKSLVLMCGPEAMYSHSIKILNQKGILGKQIYVSLERRMECGIGLCQHCSCGKHLVCQDGPVFRYDKIENEVKK